MKKTIMVLMAAFMAYALFVDPTGTGLAAKTVGGWLKDGAQAIIAFVQSLFS